MALHSVSCGIGKLVILKIEIQPVMQLCNLRILTKFLHSNCSTVHFIAVKRIHYEFT
jgi:hypothetical protein